MALLQSCSHLFIKYTSCINLNIGSIGKCFQKKLTNPNVYSLYCTYNYFHKLFVFFVEHHLKLDFRSREVRILKYQQRKREW
jgi:hypothetical protein